MTYTKFIVLSCDNCGSDLRPPGRADEEYRYTSAEAVRKQAREQGWQCRRGCGDYCKACVHAKQVPGKEQTNA